MAEGRMMWFVVDNVTSQTITAGYDREESANSMCYGLNLEYGPGGRYGVEARSTAAHCRTCRCGR